MTVYRGGYGYSLYGEHTFGFDGAVKDASVTISPAASVSAAGAKTAVGLSLIHI